MEKRDHSIQQKKKEGSLFLVDIWNNYSSHSTHATWPAQWKRQMKSHFVLAYVDDKLLEELICINQPLNLMCKFYEQSRCTSFCRVLFFVASCLEFFQLCQIKDSCCFEICTTSSIFLTFFSKGIQILLFHFLCSAE